MIGFYKRSFTKFMLLDAEATLVKLKIGAQRDLSSHSEKAMEVLTDCTDGSVPESSQHTISSPQESMTIDTDSPFASVSPNSSYCQSTGNSKQHISRNVSIIHLFSKYGRSRHVLSPPCDEAMTLENGFSPCSSFKSSNSQSKSEKEQQLEHECISS